MFVSATILLIALVGSASAADDSFNVKLKFLDDGITVGLDTGTFVPAADDNLVSSCEPLDIVSLCASFQCEKYDRSIDVFSDLISLEGLKDVSIETNAPYAIHIDDRNEVTLTVYGPNGSLDYFGFETFCTGYNGFESDPLCAQLPNVPDAIEQNFWNGGANPGAGNTGWGSCIKCSDFCHVATEFYGDSSCIGLCNAYDWGDFVLPGIQESAGTNAKNGMAAWLLGLSLTSLALFVSL
ncbi:unnamed protein product [Cylindrotheca closterium]|uniref:Uncharacterized protein n=1 Tax=Cylindrotheca closterium TaxID=2856 RepID=A0AAD2JKB5_9STRA|nr:unnamed protein product [Cylindrotheca closterium]